MSVLIGAQPLYAVSGLLTGVLVGLTGVGGGSLMTPLLILLFGFNPSTAVGTDLLFATVTKSVGVAIHSAGKTVDWRIVGRLACGSLPATAITLLALAHYGIHGPAVAKTISFTLGGALLVSSSALLLRQRISLLAGRRQQDFPPRRAFWFTALVGFIVGAVVSASSVGAGAVGTVALLFLYPRLPTVRIVGSDIAHAVPLTLLAGLGHWWLGSVDLSLLKSLLVGSIPGIVLGSYAARFAPEYLVKYTLAAVLALVGIRLLTA